MLTLRNAVHRTTAPAFVYHRQTSSPRPGALSNARASTTLTRVNDLIHAVASQSIYWTGGPDDDQRIPEANLALAVLRHAVWDSVRRHAVRHPKTESSAKKAAERRHFDSNSRRDSIAFLLDDRAMGLWLDWLGLDVGWVQGLVRKLWDMEGVTA